MPTSSRPGSVLAVIVGVALLTAACSSSRTSSASTSPTEDPVASAEARVASAQADVTTANDTLTNARQTFCRESAAYVSALDRYGKLFTDSKATVGDIKTGGADLAAPRQSVSAAADSVTTAQTDVANAEKELADAQAALAAAQAAASSVVASSATPSTTTTTVVPPATAGRVKQAEADLATASAGVTDTTPVVEAAAAYNSAAFALEIAWLKLLADAGCLTDEQEAEAVAYITDYAVALQTQLQVAGYYKGPIDGIYGPQTVDAVKQLQTETGLPPTGLVDQATARALDQKMAAAEQQAAAQAMTQTAALQTVLKLTGYWTGPVDGNWTPELTDALKQFQAALGVPPTGAVDAATLAALQQALAKIKVATSTTTTTVPATTAPPTTARPGSTTTTTDSTIGITTAT